MRERGTPAKVNISNSNTRSKWKKNTQAMYHEIIIGTDQYNVDDK